MASVLPSEVVQCLQNARFLHLATCTNDHPHVSLMNYTYLPSYTSSPHPTIIMTVSPTSKKTLNLISNPHVSLLVHDWVSHRPPTSNRRESAAGVRSGSPPAEAGRSSLASLLLNLNTTALSSISATINGTARLVERGTAEEKFLKERHLENNTFADEEKDAGNGNQDGGVPRARGFWESEQETSDGGRGMYIEGEEVRVVLVRITDGRVSDWKGGVRDWNLAGPGELVNGAN